MIPRFASGAIELAIAGVKTGSLFLNEERTDSGKSETVSTSESHMASACRSAF